MHYPKFDSIERYPANETAAFVGTKDAWGIFSNFAKTPMVVNGIEFACVEQLFHYIRLNDEAEREAYLKIPLGLKLKIAAKKFAARGVQRSNWRSMAVDVMSFCLNQKYNQSDAFRQELQRSAGMYIVENVSNRRKRKLDPWGAIYDETTNEYYGQNIMGRLLMELREKGRLEYEEFTI